MVIDGRYPDTVGYLCPPISADNYHTEPYRSTHEKFIRKRYVICKIIREAAFFYHRSLYHTPNPGR